MSREVLFAPTTLGRKLPAQVDNPIDNQLLRACDHLVPVAHARGVTPNHVTFARMALGVGFLYLLFYTNAVAVPVLGILLFYFLDCLDGHLARSTDQVTELGDHLDHIADMTFFGVLLYYLYAVDYPYKKLVGAALILVLYLSCVHMGLQQKVYNLRKDQTSARAQVEQTELLNRLNLIHPFDEHEIRWTRFFGMGTLAVVVTLAVLYARVS
jgi:phosphatidylglycerophosphate synthase